MSREPPPGRKAWEPLQGSLWGPVTPRAVSPPGGLPWLDPHEPSLPCLQGDHSHLMPCSFSALRQHYRHAHFT